MNKFILAISMVCVVGCSSLTPEEKQAIKNGADVGQGNLREWSTLTPDQQYRAQFNLTGNYVVLDHNVNGTPVPPAFQAFATAAGVTTAGQ